MSDFGMRARMNSRMDSASIVTRLLSLLRSKMVILYSTHCPQCKALEMKLQKAMINYAVCTDKETMEKKGFKSAPMLETSDGTFNFSDAVKWVNSKR